MRKVAIIGTVGVPANYGDSKRLLSNLCVIIILKICNMLYIAVKNLMMMNVGYTMALRLNISV